MRTEVLTRLGWTPEREQSFDASPPKIPGRVIRRDRGGFTVTTDEGDLMSGLRGKLRSSQRSEDRPGVGDWVVVTPRVAEGTATIESVLPRSSVLLRDAAGDRTEAQVIAANVDNVFICVPADAGENPRRIERELALVSESGAQAVIVLTKSDIAASWGWLHDVARDAPVVAVHSGEDGGIDELTPWLAPGTTVVVMGPSGAGKSTLANRLLGDDLLATGAVRATDYRGRHTTTWRELVLLPCGALLIDTPGIREVSLWNATDGMAATFDDVEALGEACRFTNCSHSTEPGCAIQAALSDGSLDPSRWAGFTKLQGELEVQTRRREAQEADELRRASASTKTARSRNRR